MVHNAVSFTGKFSIKIFLNQILEKHETLLLLKSHKASTSVVNGLQFLTFLMFMHVHISLLLYLSSGIKNKIERDILGSPEPSDAETISSESSSSESEEDLGKNQLHNTFHAFFFSLWKK